MTQYYIIGLRIIHIFGGMFWVGSAWITAGFLTPAADALGPDAGKFMAYLTRVRHFPQAIIGAAVFNVGAGVLLYWERWRGLNLSTPWGIVVTIGAMCAIIALAIGITVIAPAIDKLVTLGQQIASAGKPPNPEQIATLTRLQSTLRRSGITDAILVTVTLLAMASGRYL